MNTETIKSSEDQNIQYTLQCNDTDGCKLVKTETNKSGEISSDKNANNLDDTFNEVLKETIKSKRGFGKRKNGVHSQPSGGQCACGK